MTITIESKQHIISKDEMYQLLASIGNKRDRALITGLYWSGRRVSEVLALTFKDIKVKKNTAGDLTMYVNFKILKKRKIESFITTPFPFDDPIAKFFIDWVIQIQMTTANYQWKRLFDITLQRAWQIVKARVSPVIGTHWFRHNRASHLGTVMTEIELMAYFGWSSTSTARPYIHSNPDHVLKRMKEI